MKVSPEKTSLDAARKKLFIYDHAGHPFQIQLSRELARRGWDVIHAYCADLLTPRGDLLDDPTLPLRIAPVDLGSKFQRHGTWSRWNQERELSRKLVALVREHRSNIVVAANAPLRTQAILQREVRRRGIPYVFWIQDLLSIGIRKALRARWGIFGQIVGAYFRWYEDRIVRTAQHSIAISEDFVPFLPKEPVRSGRVTVIRNWAPLQELPVAKRRNAWARANGVSDGVNFVYAGTLGLKHNPTALLALAERLLALDAVVTVVSEGMAAEWLRQESLRRSLCNVKVLPFQAFERMSEVLGAGDVLIALLEREAGVFSVPSKILTYLCAGRPVLAAVPRNNLAARIIKEAEAGICVEPDDVPGFADAGARLAVDDVARVCMGKAGRAYAEREFDPERIVDRFQGILEAAMQQCKSPARV